MQPASLMAGRSHYCWSLAKFHEGFFALSSMTGCARIWRFAMVHRLARHGLEEKMNGHQDISALGHPTPARLLG